MNYRLVAQQLSLLIIVLSAILALIAAWAFEQWKWGLGGAAEEDAFWALIVSAGAGLVGGGLGYALARQRLAAHAPVDDARILCVGDGIATDIQGGVGEGLDTLFITGGLAAEDFGPDPLNPDPALLQAWLESHQMSPSAAISKLR